MWQNGIWKEFVPPLLVLKAEIGLYLQSGSYASVLLIEHIPVFILGKSGNALGKGSFISFRRCTVQIITYHFLAAVPSSTSMQLSFDDNAKSLELDILHPGPDPTFIYHMQQFPFQGISCNVPLLSSATALTLSIFICGLFHPTDSNLLFPTERKMSEQRL